MNNVRYEKAGKSEVTASGLSRGAGIFAILGGLLYIVIQFVHPSEHIDAVGSASWSIVACLTLAMSLFSFIGIAGVYGRQVTETGWPGLAGFLIFGLFWIASIAFSFVEAFVLPLIVSEAPTFVEGFLGIFGEADSEAYLGVFPILAPIAGGMYLLGGLLLGIATFRAGILPRMAGALLALGAAVTLAGAIIPHPYDRILAVPTGLAFIWLGYALCRKPYFSAAPR